MSEHDQPDADATTIATVLTSQREALAMALAAHREDPPGVASMFNGSQDNAALVWALARLPALLATAADPDADPEELLERSIAAFPHTLDDIDPED